MWTWPLAVVSERSSAPARVQNWPSGLHKGAQLSGKASVETAGSRHLVVSTHSFCLPVPLYVLTHTQW